MSVRHERIFLLLLSLAFIAVLAGAAGCVNSSAPAITPGSPQPGATIASTHGTVNATVPATIPRPAQVCHCPMIPAGEPVTPLTPCPDDGLCHCP